jgi:hybrid cluster-associated redox disulfide protein
MPSPISLITAESCVGEMMRAYPATTAVFLRRRMHCPGCHMAAFMTIREAAASYGLCVEELLRDLRAAAPLAEDGRRL